MIYISLTTVPLRLNYWSSIEQNLISLLNQKTDKPYFVVFSIPEYYKINDNEKYNVPGELYGFANKHPNLIINRETPDYGPIIKIYGALKYAKDPNDIIIALDDDQYYHEDMLEYHVKKLNEHPNNAICFRGDMGLDKRVWIEDGVKKFVFRTDNPLFPVNRDVYLGVPGHWHSVGYWRRFFGDDFNEDLFKMADGDDIIMGYYLKKHEYFALCVKWENETDFRPIVDPCGYKPTETFPIHHPLPYDYNSGGWLIRKKFKESGSTEGGCHGREDPIISDFLHDQDIIYIEK